MAYTLRLDIYYFQLKRITGTIERKRPTGISIGYRTEKDPVEFRDFVKSLSLKKEEDADYMKVLVQNFVNEFNASFAVNDERTKALSLNSDYKTNSSKYTAWGTFKGGETGISRDIYDNDNSMNAMSQIKENNVAALQFFYKIWIPRDSNVGVLMLQSYTTLGCTSLFKQKFEEYIIRQNYKIHWSKCIPENYIKEYFKRGYINKIQIVHHKKASDTLSQPTFMPVCQAKKETYLTKLRILLAELLLKHNYAELLKSDISSIDLNFNKEKDVVTLFYELDGKRAHSTLSDIENMLPIIKLDEELKDPTTQLPKWDELHIYTDGILEQIKKQIHYTPKEL